MPERKVQDAMTSRLQSISLGATSCQHDAARNSVGRLGLFNSWKRLFALHLGHDMQFIGNPVRSHRYSGGDGATAEAPNSKGPLQNPYGLSRQALRIR